MNIRIGPHGGPRLDAVGQLTGGQVSPAVTTTLPICWFDSR